MRLDLSAQGHQVGSKGIRAPSGGCCHLLQTLGTLLSLPGTTISAERSRTLLGGLLLGASVSRSPEGCGCTVV